MSQQWYCRGDEQQIGPISAREMRRLARIGKLTPQTEVRLEEEGQWVAAALVPGLFGNSKSRKKTSTTSNRSNPAAVAAAAFSASVEAEDTSLLEDFDPSEVIAEHEAAITDTQPDTPLVPPPAKAAPAKPPRAAADVPPIQLETPSHASTPSLLVDRSVRLRRQINKLCVASGLLSVVAVALYALPAIPILVALAATILAVRALGKVDNKSSVGFGLPAVSAALSLFAVAFGIYTTFFYDGGLSRWQPMIAGTTDDPATDQSDKAPENTPTDGTWHSATAGPVITGDVQLQVMSVEIGPLDLGDGPAADRLRAELGEDALFVTLQVGNRSEHRKLDYSSWSGFGGGTVMPSLQDNFSNRYQRVRLRSGLPGVEQLSKAAIYPGKAVYDTLVFQAPVASSTELDLELSLLALGSEGQLRIKIPRAMIGTREPQPEQLASNTPTESEIKDAEPSEEGPLLDFQRDMNQPRGRDSVGLPGDEELDRLANQEPDFAGRAGEIPLPGESLGDGPARQPGGAVDDGKFVRSPFGDNSNDAPAKPQPRVVPAPVDAADAAPRVIDPVLPLHGSDIAKPDLVTPDDLQPPRDDPFRELQD